MSNDDEESPKERRPRDLLSEIADGVAQVREAAEKLSASHPEHRQLVQDAEWHVRGVQYHFSNLVRSYEEFAQGVAERSQAKFADGGRPDFIIMFSPAFQQGMFELYALVNLVRIALDSLRRFLQPTFVTSFGNIPKSVTDLLSGETDCPVYKALQSLDDVNYLCDLRNCLVHYRTLWTSDNMLVVDENVSAADLQQLDDAGDWLRLMARSTFRRTETGIVVNIMLPDRIFEREENSKRLVKFSYAKKWNMLVASRDFTNLVIFPVLMTFTALAKVAQPTYKWMRPKKGEAG